MAKFTISPGWLHSCSIKYTLGYNHRDVIYLYFTKDNKVYAFNEWEVPGHKFSDVTRSEFYAGLHSRKYLDYSDSNLTKDIEIFKTYKLTNEENIKLQKFFIKNLNKEEYLEDPLISDSELSNNTITIVYSSMAITPCPTNKHIFNFTSDKYNFEKLLKAIGLYYNLSDLADFHIHNNKIVYLVLTYPPSSSEAHVWTNAINLILNSVSITGSRYIWDGGAYNRLSGYIIEGYSAGIHTNRKNISPIDKHKMYLNGLSPKEIEAKRLIISYLQHYRPLGITNLTKFKNYIGL